MTQIYLRLLGHAPIEKFELNPMYTSRPGIDPTLDRVPTRPTCSKGRAHKAKSNMLVGTCPITLNPDFQLAQHMIVF